MGLLVFQKTSTGHAKLRFSYPWRIVFLLCFVLFIAIPIQAQEPVWPALVLAALAFVAGLYTSTWIFDLSDRPEVTRRSGLWPVLKSETFDLSHLSSVTLAGAHDSSLPRLKKEKGIIRLILRRGEETPVTLSVESAKRRKEMHALADQLAEFLQVPKELAERP